jgi:hypothetical protein
MTLRAVRELLALKALEEADAAGHLVGWDVRASASRAAGLAELKSTPTRVDAPLMARLESRAARLRLERGVDEAVSAVSQSASRPMRGAWFAAGVPTVALVMGFLSNQIGSEKHLNLLSLPMLGLFAWNLFVYAWVIAMAATSRAKKDVSGGWLTRWLAGSEATQAAAARQEGRNADVAAQAKWRFWERWSLVVKAEAGSWVEIIFHGSALALTVGMISGMYARGVASEYTAAWESTFLKAPAVSHVLHAAIGPAATLMGRPLPIDFEPLNIHAQASLPPKERETAKEWIHCYALTALLLIVLPRLALVGWAAWALRRGAAADGVKRDLVHWHDALQREARGAGLVITALSFAHELSPRRRDEARGLLHRIWPSAGHVEFAPVIPYGDEDDALEAGKETWSRRMAIIMSLSATPEDEVHGAFVRALADRSVIDRDESALVVLVDSLGFQEQFHAMPEAERRLKERRAAWERTLDDVMTAAQSEENGYYVWRRIGPSRSAR